jgi:hypothetical protein
MAKALACCGGDANLFSSSPIAIRIISMASSKSTIEVDVYASSQEIRDLVE